MPIKVLSFFSPNVSYNPRNFPVITHFRLAVRIEKRGALVTAASIFRLALKWQKKSAFSAMLVKLSQLSDCDNHRYQIAKCRF